MDRSDDLLESSYDPNLSYDERRRLRKLKRELKQQKSSGYESSSSSVSSSSSSKSSRYSSPVTYPPPTSTQTRLQTTGRRTTHPPVKVGDKTAISVCTSRGKKTSFGTNNSKSSSTSTQHSTTTPAPHTIIPTQHTSPHTRGTGDAGPKPHTHSDSMHIPSALHLAGRARPSTTTTRSYSPQSPHSPSMVGHASRHLSSIIAQQQERERSCSPLTTPTSSRDTPPGDKASSVFTFHSEDRKAKDCGRCSESSAVARQQEQTQPGVKTATGYSATSSRATTKSDSLSTASLIGAPEDRAGSGLSMLSSSSSFTFDSVDLLTSPLGFKPDTPPPHSFAANLRFVDTGSPASPSQVYSEEPTTIRGSMQRTNVVYGSHEEDVTAITRIPGSGFFDPSQTQSQADFAGLSSPRSAGIGMIEEKWETDDTEKKTGKEKKKSRRSPFRHLRKGSVEKVIVEEEEGDIVTTKREQTKKKDGKKSPSKKSVESKQQDLGETDVTSLEHKTVRSPIRKVYSSRLPPQQTSPVKSKKTSQSFREDLREESLSPVRRAFGSFASPSSSSRGSREETPESGASSESSSQEKKRKPSLAKRFVSMVVGGSGKESPKTPKPTMANPVVLKNYRILEEDELHFPDNPPSSEVSAASPSRSAGRAPSDEDDLTSISAPTLTLVGPSGDFSGGNLRSHSSSASLVLHTERAAESSPVKRTSSLSSPPLSSRKKASVGSAGRKRGLVSKVSGSKEVKSSTRAAAQLIPGSPRKTSSLANGSSKSGLSPHKTSSTTGLSPKSNLSPRRISDVSSKSSPLSPRKTSTVAKGSPKSSPLSPRKASTVAKGSSKSSPLSPRKTSTAKRSPKSSPLSPRKTSTTVAKASTSTTTITDPPKSSPRKVSRLTVSTSSPPSSRKVSSTSATQKNTFGSSPVTLKKNTTKTGSTVTTSVTFRSSSPPTGSKKVSSLSSSSLRTDSGDSASLKSLSPPQSPSTPKPSPMSGRKVVIKSFKTTPTGSPTSTKKSTASLFKASPLLTRKTSSSSTTSRTSTLSVSSFSPPKRSSPQSSFRQPAPPRFAKLPLDAHSSPSRSTGAGSTPTIAPHQAKLSPSIKQESAAAAEKKSPSFSRFSKLRQPIKQMRSPDHSKVSSPVTKHNTLKLTPDLDTRKRRIGVSLSETPMLSPTVESCFYMVVPEHPLGSQATKLDLNVDSLLTSVEQRLSHMVTDQSQAKNFSPAVMTTLR